MDISGNENKTEKECNRIISLGMQQIAMLFTEGEMIKAKDRQEINSEQYGVFREVADKHWDKWSKRVEREERRQRRRL